MAEDSPKPRKKLRRYDTAGHARELTFSCYHRYGYLKDHTVCSIFLEELNNTRIEFNFKVWAYVLMPNHVHLLLYPNHISFKLSVALQAMKGRTAKRYGEHLQEAAPQLYRQYCIGTDDNKRFRFWQAGGGFDRNLWNAKALHSSIRYIEANPVFDAINATA